MRPVLTDQLHTAYSQGIFLLESAADHLMLFAKALDEPVQTLSPWTCIRSALEASAVSVWLLSQGSTADERIGRSFGRRIQGLIEMKKLAMVSSQEEFRVHASGRLEQALSYSKELGINVVPIPSSTMIIKQMLDEEWLYRSLSAIAHGHHWALLKFGFGMPEVLSDGQGMYKASKELNPNFSCWAGMKAFRTTSRAAWCLVNLFGLDRDRFQAIVDHTYERVGVEPMGDLFWRNR